MRRTVLVSPTAFSSKTSDITSPSSNGWRIGKEDKSRTEGKKGKLTFKCLLKPPPVSLEIC